MFATFARSWEFSKMSYRLIGEHKRLVIFPLISSLAAVLVMASFALPLWQSGQLAEWMSFMDSESARQGDVAMYVTAFLFYFCTYFAMVFFNTGLVACVLNIVNGGTSSISYGLSFAVKRMPQILGWALVSAIFGVLLKAIENSNEKAGAFVSWLLGSAWTALTYFVVPVIVVDGVGPVGAFRKSTGILRSTWGTALAGSFSMGLIGFLIMLPVVLVLGGLFFLGAFSNTLAGILTAVAVAIPALMVVAAITSAADAVFKVYLYAYATGRTMPADVDTSGFSDAFRHRR